MKKIVVLSILCVVKLFSTEWFTYEEALKIQKVNSKIIMIDVVREHCRYCILMDELFKDKELALWLKERFIPVKLNLDKDSIELNPAVKMTPSFYFLDKDQNIVKIIPGSWSKKDFMDLTKNIKGE